jgi:hypothetical protein
VAVIDGSTTERLRRLMSDDCGHERGRHDENLSLNQPHTTVERRRLQRNALKTRREKEPPNIEAG